MISEEGKVRETRPGEARIETVRSGSCGSCAARGACSHLGGGREATVWVTDPLGVSVGDRVRVAVPERTILRASVAVYLVPVLALVGGAVVGNALGPRWGVSADLAAAGLGLGAMAVALVGSRAFARPGDGPRIEERL